MTTAQMDWNEDQENDGLHSVYRLNTISGWGE
jgi:hypothetical protein